MQLDLLEQEERGLACYARDTGKSMITKSLGDGSPVLEHATKWFLLKPKAISTHSSVFAW